MKNIGRKKDYINEFSEGLPLPCEGSDLNQGQSCPKRCEHRKALVGSPGGLGLKAADGLVAAGDVLLQLLYNASYLYPHKPRLSPPP